MARHGNARLRRAKISVNSFGNRAVSDGLSINSFWVSGGFY